MTEDLEKFESVFGQAEGVLEASVPHALLPFTFYLHTKEGNCLRLQITDFHSNTWQIEMTLQRLEDLRDEVGIGGSWSDFLQYLRDAFSSNNVKLILGGPANSIGGHGATSAKIVTQKTKGTPRVSIALEKSAGASAKDTMGNIAFELFKNFKQQSDVLAAEKTQTSQLIQALAAEKERSLLLQQQVDALSFTGKRKFRGALQRHFTSSLDAMGASLSQYDTQNTNMPAFTQDSIAAGDSKTKVTSRPVATRNKAHMAHARRAKQRGAHLATVDEE